MNYLSNMQIVFDISQKKKIFFNSFFFFFLRFDTLDFENNGFLFFEIQN